MREISFRGKVTEKGSGPQLGETGAWRYFSFSDIDDIYDLWFNLSEGYIDPATVSQFTGLKDSKGVDVYDGDVVEHKDTCGDTPPEFSRFVVKFANGGFYLSYIGDDGDNEYDSDILIQPITVISDKFKG